MSEFLGDMRRSDMPVLSPIEHIRLTIAVLVGAIAVCTLSILFCGTGWDRVLAYGAGAIPVFIILEYLLPRWMLRQGRVAITLTEWNAARAASRRHWLVSLVSGFLWGLCITAVATRKDFLGQKALEASIGTALFCAVVWLIVSRVFTTDRAANIPTDRNLS